MPLPKILRRNLKWYYLNDKLMHEGDCCCECEPCDEEWMEYSMPENIDVETPFGIFHYTKRVVGACLPVCVEIEGTSYVQLQCAYEAACITRCETESCTQLIACTTATTALCPCSNCGGVGTSSCTFTHEFDGEVVYSLYSAAAPRNYLNVSQRKNCETGEWEIKFRFDYAFTQTMAGFFKGYYNITQTNVTCASCDIENYPSNLTLVGCGTYTSEEVAAMDDFYTPPRCEVLRGIANGSGMFGPNWGKGIVEIDTDWLPTSGINVDMAFTPELIPTGVVNVTSGPIGCLGSIIPTRFTPGHSRYVEINVPAVCNDLECSDSISGSFTAECIDKTRDQPDVSNVLYSATAYAVPFEVHNLDFL